MLASEVATEHGNLQQIGGKGPEQSRGEFPRAPSKTRTNDAGLPICRRLTTFHLGLFSSQKSLRRTASQTLSRGHPHSSNSRNGAVESRDRRYCISSLTNAWSGFDETT